MTFEEYKELYATTIIYYQIIENDVKLIYSYMLKGDNEEIYNKISKNTLGQIIEKLWTLDHSDNDPLISANAYNFLKQLTTNRNYWVHMAIIDFIYIENYWSSDKYKKSCKRLKKDNTRIMEVHKKLQDIKINFCKKV